MPEGGHSVNVCNICGGWHPTVAHVDDRADHEATEQDRPLARTADVVANLKAQFLDDPIYRKILELSRRDTGLFIESENYADVPELAMMVEARQKAINDILLQKHGQGINQVVEVGAGLSTRSLQLAGEFEAFFDTDLGENVALRRAITALEPHDNVITREFNVLDEEQTSEIAEKLHGKPTAVVAEGVFTYFTRKQMDQTFQNLEKLLGEHGVVVFDIATQKGLGADRSSWSKESRELLQNLYRASDVKPEELAFQNLKEVKEYFTKLGFSVAFADARRGMDEESIKKYGGVSDEAKKFILDSPSIVILEARSRKGI